MLRPYFILFYIIIFCPGCVVHSQEAELESLTIETAAGATIHYQVEIARSKRERARGLMFRESMPEESGMLFIYRPDRVASMWMKNTLISLDMLFIDKQGKIVKIEAATVPGSTRTISSSINVRAVLELNAGQAEKRGISLGDTIHHSVFH